MKTQLATRAVRVGQYPDLADAHCEPVAMTSAYVFASAAEAAGRFAGTTRGNVYSRFTNPSVRAFEQRLAALEDAEDCVAFASGMAAIVGIAHAWLSQGQNLVCSRDVFGTTLTAFRQYFGKLGAQVRLVDLASSEAWQQAIDERTAFVFFETPSNPMLRVADVPAICRMAHRVGALAVVDNTLLTPVQQNPLALGADLVMHSAGKYLDGQGRCVAGAVVGSERLLAELRVVMRVLGSTLGAMDAWLLLKSLETLELRVEATARKTLQLARWLNAHVKVGRVHYTGLTSHPQHALAGQQQSGHGGVLSFEAGASRESAWQVVDALRLVSIATSIGDTRSMITHPASTTHGKLAPEDRLKAGIGENLLRLSVGLEHEGDLMADLHAALTLLPDTAPAPEPAPLPGGPQAHAAP